MSGPSLERAWRAGEDAWRASLRLEGGRLTGRLEGANCRGPEKARRVGALLEERGLENAEVWAYGDSDDDAALLGGADHPLRVDGVRVERDL